MSQTPLMARLRSYKRKYYKNQLLKGSILTLALVISAYLTVSSLEYFGRFSSGVRTVLFFGFVGAAVFSLVRWMLWPLYQLMYADKYLSDEAAAQQIGGFFPQVGDRLLNFLQLGQVQHGSPDLLAASLAQKSAQLDPIPFEEAVEYKKNRRYLRFLIVPIALGVGLLLLFTPDFFTQSTTRLVNFSEEFIPEAPFQFRLLSQELRAFRDEDLPISLQLEGKALPESVYLFTDRGSRIKLEHTGNGRYQHTFKSVQRPFGFYFESEGFRSQAYAVELLDRPLLRDFQVQLTYPAYTGKRNERLQNMGNLTVPEGTRIEWTFETKAADDLRVRFQTDSLPATATRQDEGRFVFAQQARRSESYQVQLQNPHSTNREPIAYYLQVIPDQYPEITLRAYQDSVLYDYLLLAGGISDDYGIRRLALQYRIVNPKRPDPNLPYQSEAITFAPNSQSQEYFHQVDLTKLQLQPGQRLEYFVEVWDNDGINGSKKSRTGSFQFAMPDARELRQEIAQNTSQAKEELTQAQQQAKDLQRQIESLQDRLKGKKQLSWQDKQAAQELLQKNEALKKELEEAAKKNQSLNQQQERLNEQEERIAEKTQQLQKLMEEVMDEETQKLFEELNRLLEENANAEDIQKVLDKLQRNNQNVEKELDRSLEMFKQLQVELELKNLQKQLQDLAKQQQDLAEQTEQKAQGEDAPAEQKEKALEDIQQEQQELNKAFEELQDQLQDIQKKNEDLKNPKPMEDFEQQSQEIEQDQQKANDALEQKDAQKAAEQQQKAGQKMQRMAQQMQQMMQSGEMEAAMEDYQTLRQILDNLIKLSFEQEEILDGFGEVQQADPRFLTLSQRQIKLKDDAKVVEDSLRALAERVFQIESFVTRELTNMNDYLDQSIEAVKERRPRVAITKQQFAMTAINNLALLLNDVLDQMQNAMASMMPGQQMANKPGNTPSMSQMQEQLNQQIQDLKKSGKSGRQLSEQLAQMAAQQEAIRRALQKQQSGKPDKGKDGNSIGELLEQMEKTEEDLVNKRLTDELLQRQRDIVTRLLESEKANRERDEKEEREAERPNAPKKRERPPAFEEYLRLKKKQIEQLKTIPPDLTPYYKREVYKYFQSIKEQP